MSRHSKSFKSILQPYEGEFEFVVNSNFPLTLFNTCIIRIIRICID